MSAEQLVLFEPTGPEIAALVLGHVRKAAQSQSRADVFKARGWMVLCNEATYAAQAHDTAAECLSMLADFECLGRVHAS